MSNKTEQDKVKYEIAKLILSGDGRLSEPYDASYNDIYNFNSDGYETWMDHLMKNSTPFNMQEFRKMCYDQDIKALETSYHFETQGWNEKLGCITFTRTVERGEIHEVTLEDHRDDESINDWLIFSSLKDSITDFGGMPNDAQYPLELGEYKLFARLIGSIECLYPLENSKPPIVSETK